MTNQHPRVTATDDPELAERLGFTEWDEDRQQYVAPTAQDTPGKSGKSAKETTVEVDTKAPDATGSPSGQSQATPATPAQPVKPKAQEK